MNVYLLLIVWILILSLIFPKRKRSYKFVIFVFLALFIVMGMRDAFRIGYDSTSSYLLGYKGAPFSHISITDYNFAFSLLMKLIAKTGLDYQWFLVITAAFVCFSYGWLISKYSIDPLVSVFWYMGMLYYILMFSALKQAFAMAFLCYAYDAIMREKPIRFVAFVLIAGAFHFPALVFLPAYWIIKMKIDKHFLPMLAGMLLIVFLFRSQIVRFVESMYYEEDAHAFADSVSFLGTKVVLMILIVIVGILLRKPDAENDRECTALLMFSGIAIVFQTFCYYNNIFERLADYYYVFSILYLPMIFEPQAVPETSTDYDPTPLAQSLGRYVVIAFCIWRFLNITTNDEFLYPFYFFWQR